jgi:hypothetical protein
MKGETKREIEGVIYGGTEGLQRGVPVLFKKQKQAEFPRSSRL